MDLLENFGSSIQSESTKIEATKGVTGDERGDDWLEDAKDFEASSFSSYSYRRRN